MREAFRVVDVVEVRVEVAAVGPVRGALVLDLDVHVRPRIRSDSDDEQSCSFTHASVQDLLVQTGHVEEPGVHGFVGDQHEGCALALGLHGVPVEGYDVRSASVWKDGRVMEAWREEELVLGLFAIGDPLRVHLEGVADVHPQESFGVDVEEQPGSLLVLSDHVRRQGLQLLLGDLVLQPGLHIQDAALVGISLGGDAISIVMAYDEPV